MVERSTMWLPFAALVSMGVAIATSAWFVINEGLQWFSFEHYETSGPGDELPELRAKWALEKIVPLGSTIDAYQAFFRAEGGECAKVADAAHYPNAAICSYVHGSIFLISAEWKYVVEFDPVTGKSTQAQMNFGLTGP